MAKDYAAALNAAGIEVAALTDYNGIRTDWYGAIREEGEAIGITVLPGAEVSFSAGKYGLHILTIFSPDTDAEEVNRFLLGLDRDSARPLIGSDGQHRDIESKVNIPESVRSIIDRFRCLLIIPHPDQGNGLFRSFQTVDAARYLLELAPDALEHCPKSELNKIASTGVIARGALDRLACVEFSDPKHLSEIGTKAAGGEPRVTHLKLSSRTVDAVRLALRDPETRVVSGQPPVVPHPRIAGVTVEGSGFLSGVAVRWNDDLNTVIGGRGTGKSAVLESMRYALDLDAYEDAKYRHELVKYALGSGGRVSVVLERPTGNKMAKRYLVTRVLGEAPTVHDADTGEVVGVPPCELFGPSMEPMVLGQREIQAVSTNESYRLQLIDDLIGDGAKQAGGQVAAGRSHLANNAKQILEHIRLLEKHTDVQQRLESIGHEMQIYAEQGVAEKLRRFTDLSADRETLRRAREVLEAARGKTDAALGAADKELSVSSSALRAGKSVQASLLASSGDALASLRATIVEVKEALSSAFAKTASEVGAIEEEWARVLAPLDEELQALKVELNSEVLSPDRLIALSGEQARLTAANAERATVELGLSRLEGEREHLLEEFRERRYEEHALRREKCEEIGQRLRGRLRLEVRFKGDKQEFRRELINLFKGSGISGDALERLTSPEAADGLLIAAAVEGGSEELRKQFGLTATMAQKVTDWITSDAARAFELQSLIPSDSVEIELLVDAQPRPLDKLSAGQRATAILLLLFAQRQRPLVLDQPEDDLDNRFVYEDIVTLLREEKGLRDPDMRRQIIAATHNANLPVLGDAELVLALEAHEGRAVVMGRASIDDEVTRNQVRTILEGGEEAFRKRAEKYGGLAAN